MRSAHFVCTMLIGLSMALSAVATGVHADDSADPIHRPGTHGGLVVHVGCDETLWTTRLETSDSFLLQGLTPDAAMAERLQTRLRKQGRLGSVTVHHWTGKRLPYADNLVNLVVVEPGIDLTAEEIRRVLVPGGTALIRGEKDEQWTKPWPDSIDEWTHFLHGPNNNAVADDTEIGPPHHLQWNAGPRWGRTHDQLASLSAAVSAAGRLFYIVDEGSIASVKEPARWMLVARDAFNGVLLWKRPIGPWENHLRPFRGGPAELPRRLVAVGNRVYVTLGYGKPVTALDAVTGRTIRTYAGTEGAQEILLSDGRLYVVAGKGPEEQPGAPVPELPEWLVSYPQRVYTHSPKRLVCLDAESGKSLWTRDDKQTANLLPLTLAVAGGRAFFHNEDHLVALDADSGETVWKAGRPISLDRYAWSTPTVVVEDGVVLSADRTAEEKMDFGRRTDRRPRWLVSSGHDLFGGELIAFSADDGEELWRADCHENFNAPVDVFVARGKVWSGQVAWGQQPGIAEVYDLKTGEVVATRPPDSKFGRFGHHRCYRAKATVNYALHSRRGIEFVEMDTEQLLIDRWARGTCQYGLLPCNGMIYTPPHSCACYVTYQLNSFNALRAAREAAPPDDSPRLARGPAYELPPPTSGRRAGAKGTDPSNNWPTYRGDAARSGSTPHAAPLKAKIAWECSLGGEVTPPVAAVGRLFVAQPRTHTLYALDAADGSVLWTFSAGAPIDSPPTICQVGRISNPSYQEGGLETRSAPLCLFGSADGWVYCLQASDGELVWRRRVAPESRQIVSYDRLESAWPVHGSLLPTEAADGSAIVCGAAGRSTYLDGGIVLFGLDAATGEAVFRRRLYCPSPENVAKSQPNPGETIRINVLPDVLSTDGEHLFMRNQAFDSRGNPVSKRISHLFCSAGFLDDTWWHRTYWQYGADMGSGYGGWINAGNRSISGRLLVRRGDRIFGFGRKEYRKTGSHPGLNAKHHLFAAAIPAAAESEPTGKGKRRQSSSSAAVHYEWSIDIPFMVRAMLLADDRLLVAGPERIADLNAAKPGGNVHLWAVSAREGEKIDHYELSVAPVFDGLALSEGRLYVTLVDGRVVCYR